MRRLAIPSLVVALLVPLAATAQGVPDSGITGVASCVPAIFAVTAGLSVDFAATCRAADYCRWDFGDRKSGEGVAIRHDFPGDGEYTVTATCGESAASRTLTVSSASTYTGSGLVPFGVGIAVLVVLGASVLFFSRRIRAKRGSEAGSHQAGRAGTAGPDAGPGAPRSGFWRRLRHRKVTLGLLLLALLVLAWGGVAAAEVLSAQRQASAAEESAREAADLVGAGDLEGGSAALHRALDALADAQASLASPWVGPLRLAPFTGTELRAAEAVVVGVRAASLATVGVLDYVLADRSPLYSAGRLEVGGLESLGTVLSEALGHAADARAALNGAPDPRLGFVARRLEEAEELAADLYDALNGAVPLVDRLGEAASGSRPYRLLLLLENGAERRATGGLAGWYALLEVDEEGVHLPAFGSVVGALQVLDEEGQFVAVEAPDDYVQRYGELLANTTLWANVNMSPDFPTVADVARRLYRVSTGVEADAVARVDLVGLGYLLDAFPGLTLEGQELAGSTLATDFLIDSYRRFPEDTRPGEQNAYLGEAMQEVVGQLLSGAHSDRGDLLQAVRRAVGERRLSVVTVDAAVNTMLSVGNADGSVLPGGPGDLMVTTQNLALNKIDLFTRTSLTVQVTADLCRVAGEISVTLTNATPAGMDWLPHWTLGSLGRWMVSIYVPRGAAVLSLEVDGVPVEGTFLEELGRPVASAVVDAEVGESVDVTVRWQEQLTESGYTLTLPPQSLVVPATLSVNGEPALPFVETQVREISGMCAG